MPTIIPTVTRPHVEGMSKFNIVYIRRIICRVADCRDPTDMKNSDTPSQFYFWKYFSQYQFLLNPAISSPNLSAAF